MTGTKKIRNYLAATLFLFCSCGSENPDRYTDRYDKGVIHISADESFKPVIDSQVQVYETKYPETRLIVHYKPEAECVKDLYVDSIRMIISTKQFSKEEQEFVYDSIGQVAEQLIIAYDAVSVIVHPSSPDSLFTMKDLKNILTGKFRKNLIPVFDGLKATSTVQYIVDSVLKGDSLTSSALAAKTSEEVVNYIARTPNAIGFIGVSWIGNPEDRQQISFLTKVKLAEIESTDVPGKFVQPYQANIYTGRYPMIRKLGYILKESNRHGLGHGFANFMSGEQGQLIFRRAYLVPALMQFNVRKAALRE